MMNDRLIRPDPYLYFGYVPIPRTKRVMIDGAPRCLHGVRALFCTDVHLRARTSEERLRAIIDAIAAAKADLLLLGGDYGEGDAQCARFFNALRRVRFPLGIYAVPGNNDPRTPPSMDAQYLINREVRLQINGGTLLIGGVDEAANGTPDAHNLLRSPADYRILLSHFPIIADCPADLMLCGHTHAGQINLLGITPYSVGYERDFRILAQRGLHTINGQRIYVSRGIGNSKLPIRLGAAPEITIFVFS